MQRYFDGFVSIAQASEIVSCWSRWRELRSDAKPYVESKIAADSRKTRQ